MKKPRFLSPQLGESRSEVEIPAHAAVPVARHCSQSSQSQGLRQLGHSGLGVETWSRSGVDLESMDFSADFICTSGGSELPTLGYIGRRLEMTKFQGISVQLFGNKAKAKVHESRWMTSAVCLGTAGNHPEFSHLEVKIYV